MWAAKQDRNFRGCRFKNTAASQKNLGNLRERNQGRENNLLEIQDPPGAPTLPLPRLRFQWEIHLGNNRVAHRVVCLSLHHLQTVFPWSRKELENGATFHVERLGLFALPPTLTWLILTPRLKTNSRNCPGLTWAFGQRHQLLLAHSQGHFPKEKIGPKTTPIKNPSPATVERKTKSLMSSPSKAKCGRGCKTIKAADRA